MRFQSLQASCLKACAAIVAASALLGGCASVSQPLARDPWEPMNRSVSQFNDGLDAMLLKPVATAYRQGVPPLIRTGVSNFFGNLSDVWAFVNSALQFKLQNAADNFARVQINTLVGIGGIFDVASEFNIERHSEDFGQTLGRWGVPSGPYLVLPFFGPSTLRDAVAMPIDRRLDLVQRVQSQAGRNTLYGLRAVEIRSNLLRASVVLEEAALDKYSFTRDVYLQRRRAEVYEGQDDAGAGSPQSPDEPEPVSPPAR